MFPKTGSPCEHKDSHLTPPVRIRKLQTWNRINLSGTYHNLGFNKAGLFWLTKPTSLKVPRKTFISYFSFVPYFFTCLSQSTNQQTLVLWLLRASGLFFFFQALFHHYPFIFWNTHWVVPRPKKPSPRFSPLNSIPDIKEAISAPPSTGKQCTSLDYSALPVRLKKKVWAFCLNLLLQNVIQTKW